MEFFRLRMRLKTPICTIDETRRCLSTCISSYFIIVIRPKITDVMRPCCRINTSIVSSACAWPFNVDFILENDHRIESSRSCWQDFQRGCLLCDL